MAPGIHRCQLHVPKGRGATDPAPFTPWIRPCASVSLNAAARTLQVLSRIRPTKSLCKQGFVTELKPDTTAYCTNHERKYRLIDSRHAIFKHPVTYQRPLLTVAPLTKLPSPAPCPPALIGAVFHLHRVSRMHVCMCSVSGGRKKRRDRGGAGAPPSA